MDTAMPVMWRGDRRGFWTKRKKTTLSLILVLGLLAGIAMAFKLFDQLVPNNVVRDASSFSFEVWKRDAQVGDAAFVKTGPSKPVFEGTTAGTPVQLINTFPGETRKVEVRINNINVQPARDASFYVYADAFAVKDANGLAPTNQTLVSQFLNYWTFKVEKEKVLNPGGGDVANEDDHGVLKGSPNNNPDDHTRFGYAQACNDLLKSVQRIAPCKLGIVRGSGKTDAVGGRTDQRYYIFSLSEADEGDQSQFRGWSITFNLVFQARIPPEPESTSPIER